MTDNEGTSAPRSAQFPDGRDHVDEPGSRLRRWSVLLPTLTFLAGALLGGAVIGAASQDDRAASPAPRASLPAAEPTPNMSGLQAPVPASCLQAADKAEEAYGLLGEGVLAARDLDARALAALVERVQQQRPQVRSLIQQCRSAARSGTTRPVPTASGAGRHS